MQVDLQLKRQITTNLKSFEVVSRVAQGAKSAAVAMTLVDAAYGAELSGMPSFPEWQSDACLVLTKRSSELRDHSGQWALPGGKLDPGETAEQTALRELSEEVNLALEPDRVLGRLDDFVTRSGYVMTPVVVWGGPIERLEPNEHEVDSIHRIPLTEFMREDAPLLDYEELDSDQHQSDLLSPVLRMPVGDNFIAAPTAALLFQFVEVCIRARSTRVAHYEQPRFAWK